MTYESSRYMISLVPVASVYFLRMFPPSIGEYFSSTSFTR